MRSCKMKNLSMKRKKNPHILKDELEVLPDDLEGKQALREVKKTKKSKVFWLNFLTKDFAKSQASETSFTIFPPMK